jgi:hypothetical protein
VDDLAIELGGLVFDKASARLINIVHVGGASGEFIDAAKVIIAEGPAVDWNQTLRNSVAGGAGTQNVSGKGDIAYLSDT